MKKQKGFTLVELLVVIAILAILATVSIVGYTSFIKKAKISNATVELTQIRDLMIAADIDDDVVYGITKLDGNPDSNKTYYTKDANGTYSKEAKKIEAKVDNTTYYEDLKRTDLFDADGLESFEEAEALWNVIKKDCEGLKGELSFVESASNLLVYELDGVKVSYDFKNKKLETDITITAGTKTTPLPKFVPATNN